MRNQFPGTCYRCGNSVPAGEGHFERSPVSRGWRVQHAECAIAFRGTDVGKDGETERREKWAMSRLRQKALGTGRRAQKARKRLKDIDAARNHQLADATRKDGI